MCSNIPVIYWECILAAHSLFIIIQFHVDIDVIDDVSRHVAHHIVLASSCFGFDLLCKFDTLSTLLFSSVLIYA